MNGYIPGRDADFDNWVQKFDEYLSVHFARFGLTADDAAAVANALQDWTGKYEGNMTAQSAAKGACDMKNNSRKAFETIIRILVPRIQSAPGTTDEDRQAMGLTVRGASISTPVLDAVDGRPLPVIDSRQRGEHVIRFHTESSVGIKKSRPEGVVGCEIFVKVGEAPANMYDMRYLDMATKAKYVVRFDAEDIGKSVYYAMRYVNSKGEKSPWSATKSATIAA